MDYKILISSFVIFLTLVGYIPYIRDVFKKKTKPHAFTWLVFTLAGGTAYGLQIVGGAGVGSWGLLSAVVICFVIFIASICIGDKDITKSDFLFLFLAIVSLFLWVVVKQPVWSAILASATEVFGFVPTIRKSWNSPHTETLWAYQVASVRHGISIFALQSFNVLTVLYPAVWTVTNILFWVFLVVRRRNT